MRKGGLHCAWLSWVCSQYGLLLTFTKPLLQHSYVPAGWEPPKASDNETTAAGPGGNVSVDTVMKTPQFAALSAVFFRSGAASSRYILLRASGVLMFTVCMCAMHAHTSPSPVLRVEAWVSCLLPSP